MPTLRPSGRCCQSSIGFHVDNTQGRLLSAPRWRQPPLGPGGKGRLDALVETTDGFVIAERDLALRGPGDFFGTRQSGLPTLRVGDLVRDFAMMEEARREAVAWLDDARGARPLVEYLSANWAARFGLAGVG